MRLAEYLSSHVTNGETAEMLSSLASGTRADRARILRAEATREGLSSCPLADEFEAGPRP